MNIMNKKLLFVLLSCAFTFVCTNANAASGISAPTFTGGHHQYLPVCEDGGAYSINSLLIVSDLDSFDTETWSVVTNASHGSLTASYSTASTGGLIYPTGLKYTPNTGYTGTDTFSVMISDGTYFDTTTIFVSVDPVPFSGIISGSTNLCVGTSYPYTTTGNSGVWSSANANATVAGNIFTAVHSGVDSFIYTVSNGCGTSVAIQTITITTTPDVGPIFGASALCVGATISLDAPFAGGTWTATNGNATLSGTNLTGIVAGTDTIMHIATNSCGTDTAYSLVTVDGGIIIPGAITGPDSVCGGASISLSNTVAGGIWSHNAAYGTISSTGVLSATSATGTDMVLYTITNSCGSASDTAMITISSTPTSVTISGYDSVCAGSSIVLVGSIPGGTWSSSIPDFAAIDASGTVFGSLNGSAVISYTITNQCGATTATHPVRINIPAQPIAGSPTLCQGQLGILTDAVSGGSWTSSSLLTAIVFNGNVLGLTLGNTDITYTVNNACGTSSATLNIEVINCSSAVNEVTANTETISLAPNPNQGIFTINISAATNEQAVVVISNVLGEKVKELSIPTNMTSEIDFDVPAGVYSLTALVKNNRYTTRVVVSK